MTNTPGREPETRLPARRPPSEPVPAERFSSPPPIRKFELTPERAARIVRQSANARWVGFLSVIVTALFIVGYYFYELGVPGGLSEARLLTEIEHQQVVAVERGYNLYQANCARCHGPNGLGPQEPNQPAGGYIGPTLNDQGKLATHLTEEYLLSVLEVGGRYVCGSADSQMPVWSDTNGGPLNYRQIEEVIAFVRAPSDQEFEVRDASLNEPTGETFRGWRDPNYRPPPDATPVPDCWSRPEGGEETPGASLPADAPLLELTASGVEFDKKELEVPAGEAFGIHFVVDDPGQTHDVDIREADGTTVVQDQPTVGDGEETTYVYKPLEAGEYTFICSIHPIPAMTGTLTVR
jgi:mono/diheme cytochrome c family protein/plastocyanin